MRIRHCASCLAAMVLFGASLVASSPVQAQTPPKRANRYESLDVFLNPSGVRDFTTTTDILLSGLYDPISDLFGATLRPVDDILRSQLEIPAGRGLLITSLRADGPSAQAGLRQNDVLLSLGEHPLATADDLTIQLKAAGDSPVPLRMLRGGKATTIQVKPTYRVTLGPITKPQTEYFIGVSLEPVEDALRAQLALPAGQGVVITEVIKDSPAERAGVKKYDVALELAGKRVASPEAFAHQVQENRETATTLKLLRAGKPLTIPITGALRKVQADSTADFYRFAMIDLQSQLDARRAHAIATKVDEKRSASADKELNQRIDQLEKELKALRDTAEKLKESLKKSRPE